MALSSPVAPGGGTPVVIGKVGAVHGIKGWVKVHSYTRPRENLLAFSPWLLSGPKGWTPVTVDASGVSGGSITVHFRSVDDRTAAQALVGVQVAVERSQLPPLPEGQYYWVDLVGMQVVTGSGQALGLVTSVMETGANDVLEVQGEAGRFLVPYVTGHVVRTVDPKARVIHVDWNPEYQ